MKDPINVYMTLPLLLCSQIILHFSALHILQIRRTYIPVLELCINQPETFLVRLAFFSPSLYGTGMYRYMFVWRVGRQYSIRNLGLLGEQCNSSVKE